MHVAEASVGPEKRAAIESIWNSDLGFILERLVSKQYMPKGVVEEAITEYRKYMTLVLLSDEPFLMYSAEVDEVWHAHILFTREYAEFCDRIFGAFLHHAPVLSSHGPPPNAAELRQGFFRRYRELFGEPSYLWSARPGE